MYISGVVYPVSVQERTFANLHDLELVGDTISVSSRKRMEREATIKWITKFAPLSLSSRYLLFLFFFGIGRTFSTTFSSSKRQKRKKNDGRNLEKMRRTRARRCR